MNTIDPEGEEQVRALARLVLNTLTDASGEDCDKFAALIYAAAHIISEQDEPMHYLTTAMRALAVFTKEAVKTGNLLGEANRPH